MRRREFIRLLGGWMVSHPLRAHAQQHDRPKLVGILSAFSETDIKPLREAFARKLMALGWREGDNVEIELRLSDGDASALEQSARSIVQRRPDILVVQGSPALTAVLQHSRGIPVVFMLITDPVGLGFVKSLANPSGELTGFTNFEFSIGGKWVALLKQFDPELAHVLLIANPGNPSSGRFSERIEEAARGMNIVATTSYVRDAAEIENAMGTLAKSSRSALITLPDFLPVVNRDLIVRLTRELGVPSIHPFRTFPANGALMSYGLDFPELFQQTAVYVDRILRGAKPTDLPVQAPNKFELVVNLKSARSLGKEAPAALLAQADEVIE